MDERKLQVGDRVKVRGDFPVRDELCHGVVIEAENYRWPRIRFDGGEESAINPRAIERDPFETVMISKMELTGDFEVIIDLSGDREVRALLPPLLSAAMDVARNHWDEVLDLHNERQARRARAGIQDEEY